MMQKNNKILCKIKNVIYIEMLYTENTKVTNHMFPFVIYWTSENTVKYPMQKFKSDVSILSIYLINVSILSIYLINVIQCQRLWANSTTLLIPLEKEMWFWFLIRSNILFQYDEAKDIQSKDIVIDPLFPAGSLVLLCIYNMLKKPLKKKEAKRIF